MHTTASGFSAVNTVINSQLYGGLIVAAIVALGGWFSRSLFRQWRRFGWRVLSDAPINQGGPTPQQEQAPDGQQPPQSQDMWEIVYREGGTAAPQHRVAAPSRAVRREI